MGAATKPHQVAALGATRVLCVALVALTHPAAQTCAGCVYLAPADHMFCAWCHARGVWPVARARIMARSHQPHPAPPTPIHKGAGLRQVPTTRQGGPP